MSAQMSVRLPSRCTLAVGDRVDGPSSTWEQLTGLEQNLVLAAFAEKQLWVPCASLADGSDPNARFALQLAARHLVDLGLVWFYRLCDGYPDLTAAEVDCLCDDDRMWDVTGDGCHWVGLYLTDIGEDIFPMWPDTSVH